MEVLKLCVVQSMQAWNLGVPILAGEALFFDLALDDIALAADLFDPIYDSTNTVDGWTLPEVSPLLDALTPVRSYPQPSWIAS